MFTDNPTIPAQLEVLLDVVHALRQRKATVDSLRQMIQPKGLPDLTPNSRQVASHLSAATELGLITVDDNGNIRPTYPARAEHDAKLAILSAFDKVALGDANVEKWAGRFYAYLIARDDDAVRGGNTEGEGIASRFMAALPPDVDKGNPMNLSKYRALVKWYLYVGLGWTDPAKAFIPDPTARLRRALPSIWQGDRTLDASEFMKRLGRSCPELDGGALFDEVTSGVYSASERRCTKALAIALRRLHDERVLRLRCPADSKGWSLELAGAGQVSGEASNRFDFVDCVARDEV
jgi:hypothetical protein